MKAGNQREKIMVTMQGNPGSEEDEARLKMLYKKYRGELKGRFEIHFGVILATATIIDHETCLIFEKIVTRYKNLDRSETLEDFNEIFDKYFQVEKRKLLQVTPEEWDMWMSLLQLFLDTVAQREPRPAQNTGNSSR